MNDPDANDGNPDPRQQRAVPVAFSTAQTWSSPTARSLRGVLDPSKRRLGWKAAFEVLEVSQHTRLLPPEVRPQKKLLPPETASKEMLGGTVKFDPTPPAAPTHSTVCGDFPAMMPQTVPVPYTIATVEAEPIASTITGTAAGERKKKKIIVKTDMDMDDVILYEQKNR